MMQYHSTHTRRPVGQKESLCGLEQARAAAMPELEFRPLNAKGQAPGPSSSKVLHLYSGAAGRTWSSLWLEFSFSAWSCFPWSVCSPGDLMGFRFLAFDFTHIWLSTPWKWGQLAGNESTAAWPLGPLPSADVQHEARLPFCSFRVGGVPSAWWDPRGHQGNSDTSPVDFPEVDVHQLYHGSLLCSAEHLGPWFSRLPSLCLALGTIWHCCPKGMEDLKGSSRWNSKRQIAKWFY